jgi:hypothetical protein
VVVWLFSVICGLLANGVARADTLSINLSDRSQANYTSSTGLWDSVRGRISAPFASAGVAARILNFGDGTDGEFNDGPEQSGITISGSTITINTDTKSTYQFTTFTLTSGKTIRITGSAALIIRVQGAVTIAGQILAEGSAGTNSISGNTGTVAGGSGANGGFSGGNGGVGATASANGLPASGDSRGGTAGANTAAATQDEGGGGGCLGTGPDAGGNATGGSNTGTGTVANQAVCPRNRTAISADFDTGFTSAVGGGGGGGGGAFTAGSPVSGGAGGGGGGRISIVALDSVSVMAGGKVSVKGGNGGANNFVAQAGDCGGAGGGGSGGILWMRSPGSISGAGTIDIAGGTGGQSTDGVCTNLSAGGNGSRGIFRADDSDGAESGVTVSPARTAIHDSSQTVGFVTSGTYTIYSKAVPSATGLYEFDSLAVTSGCGSNGTAEVYVDGSDDGTNFGTGVLASDIATLGRKRAIRIKAVITSTGANPPCITGLTLNYRLAEISQYTLDGIPFACAPTSKSDRKDRPSGSGSFPGESALFALALAWILREKRRLAA